MHPRTATTAVAILLLGGASMAAAAPAPGAGAPSPAPGAPGPTKPGERTPEDIIRDLKRETAPATPAAPPTPGGPAGQTPATPAAPPTPSVPAAPAATPGPAMPALPAAAQPGGGARLLREGTFLASRRGRIVRLAGGEWQITFDADASGRGDPPMILMPCLNLGAMEKLAERGGEALSFTVSGQVFVYKGKNYLLPTMYAVNRQGELAPAG